MKAPKFKWFVIDHIDKVGMYFKPTDGSKYLYIFYWNPIRNLVTILKGTDWAIGWFPFKSNHIKGNW